MPDSSKLMFTAADLEQWREKGLITPEQLESIRLHIEAAGSVGEQSKAGPEQKKGLNFITVAYYFGAFMILLAYTIFMGLQWNSLGTGPQLAVSFFTIVVLWAIGFLLRRGGFKTAGGLLIFAGTGIAPLFIFTLQRALNIWPDSLDYVDFYNVVAPTWVVLELVSIAIALVMIFVTRFTLISLLIAFWTWYLSMDLTRWITHSSTWAWDNQEQIISVVIGLGMLALGVFLQRRAKQDYSLWLYLFGHLIILGNLSALTLAQQGWLGLLYLLVYLSFVIASVWLQRRVFLVFGALGVYGYVSYLAFQVFQGGLGFVYALATIGLLIVLTAVGYQKFIRGWLERQVGAYRLAKV